jgi:hypothetical protein
VRARALFAHWELKGVSREGQQVSLRSGRHVGAPLLADLRMISRQQHQEQRCKLVISDGNNSHTAMLATQLNSLVTEQQLKQGSIVCLHEYMCNAVQKKRHAPCFSPASNPCNCPSTSI